MTFSNVLLEDYVEACIVARDSKKAIVSVVFFYSFKFYISGKVVSCIFAETIPFCLIITPPLYMANTVGLFLYTTFTVNVFVKKQ